MVNKSKPTPTQAIFSWLERLSSAENPPKSIIAYNVGLFEAPHSYSAYLIGGNSYTDQDSRWTSPPKYTPQEKYLELPAKGMKWQEVHAAAVTAVREFLASPVGVESFFSRAQAITVGFDDGELERVK